MIENNKVYTTGSYDEKQITIINDKVMDVAGVNINPIEPVHRMILNPNKKVTDAIIKRIYMNDGYCPCQPRDETIDTRCPCPDFTGKGKCHCKLFVEDTLFNKIIGGQTK